MAKTSKFRHARAQVAKPDSHFLNVSPTSAIWDCGNFMTCNTQYIAVPWNLNGSTAVFRHDQFGKLPSSIPVLIGHGGPVIDLAFSPFDESLLFTGSEDATVRGWRIPSGGLAANESNSVIELKGHTKKVGILSFHPSASNVLATAAMDNSINLWDVETGSAKISLKNIFSEQILSMNWNLDGSLLNTTTRDKKVNILDSRSGAIVASADSHQGSKNQRSIWAKRKNLIVTVGFDKSQRREIMVWDCRSFAKPIKTEEIDQASSVMMPLYDEDTGMLYIGSKGDGSIRYYEILNEAPQLLSCAQYSSSDSAKGICMMPKRACDVKQCEVARFYFLGTKSMYPIRMILPRKQSEVEFQEDVYIPTFAHEPAISAKEFFDDKKNAEPKVMSLRGLFDGTACTPIAATTAPSFASPVKEEPSVEPSVLDAKRAEIAKARENVTKAREALEDAQVDLERKVAQLAALEALASPVSPKAETTPTEASDAKPAEEEAKAE